VRKKSKGDKPRRPPRTKSNIPTTLERADVFMKNLTESIKVIEKNQSNNWRVQTGARNRFVDDIEELTKGCEGKDHGHQN
jgi:hypothetical protein